jgi:hypothetical protein
MIQPGIQIAHKSGISPRTRQIFLHVDKKLPSGFHGRETVVIHYRWIHDKPITFLRGKGSEGENEKNETKAFHGTHWSPLAAHAMVILSGSRYCYRH